jgi:hypothetical protein
MSDYEERQARRLKLEIELREHMMKGTRRYHAATNAATMIQSLLQDFLIVTS